MATSLSNLGTVVLLLAITVGGCENEPTLNTDVCTDLTETMVMCNALSSEVTPEAFEEACVEDLTASSGSCRTAKSDLAGCRSQLSCEEISAADDCDEELDRLAAVCTD